MHEVGRLDSMLRSGPTVTKVLPHRRLVLLPYDKLSNRCSIVGRYIGKKHVPIASGELCTAGLLLCLK